MHRIVLRPLGHLLNRLNLHDRWGSSARFSFDRIPSLQNDLMLFDLLLFLIEHSLFRHRFVRDVFYAWESTRGSFGNGIRV